MNLAAPFIHRPVATTLVMLGLALFGVAAYQKLPVSDLPNVDFPTIQVSAALPGASPETMAAAVATQLERQFTTIAGLDSMSSVSSLGQTQITLQFSLSRSIDEAAQDVQASIARVSRLLPRDMPSPPSYQKVNPADSPILFIALTSPTLEPSALDEYGQTYIAQRISTVSGVAQVSVFGSKKYAVRVQVDPERLQAVGLGLNDVAAAIEAGNANLPTGVLWGPDRSWTIEAEGQLERAPDYRPLVIAYRNGAPVRLEQVGRVLDAVETDKALAWFVTPEQERRAVMLAVQRQPGTNTVEIAAAVRRLLPAFKQTLPASVSLEVLFDRSESIRASVDDMQLTLAGTVALVVGVIFLFLRRGTATLIPSLALPLSLLGTFAVMFILDYSLDNLSLMALVLCLGFVVDDAIVVLENIVRHIEQGKSPRQAALDGTREIGFTIVSMTISLAAVFLPVLFLGGLLGRLFREFAVTIMVAVLLSGFVSLTLTPMLCSRFLRPHDAERRPGRWYLASERVFDAALAFYRVTLGWVLRHRAATLLVTAAVLGGSVWLMMKIPKGFIPSEDTSQISITTEGVEGVSYQQMIANHQRLNEILRKNPNVAAFMSNSGGRGGSTTNSGAMFLRLVPRDQRQLSADQVVEQLRRQLNVLPGIRVYPQNPPSIRVGGRLSKSQYQFTLQGADVDELYRLAPQLEARLQQSPLLQDVTTDLLLKNPKLRVELLRDRAASLGLTATQIESALYDAFGSRQVSTIYGANNTYQVLLELLPEQQQDPAALERLQLRTASGALVPLGAVARVHRGVGPLAVNHSGQLPAVTLSFNPRPGVSLGAATDAVQLSAAELLPASIVTSFQGSAQVFQSSMQGLGLLLLLAVLVIYLVLGILYESFVHPLTILSALPFAGFGALLTLLAFGTELSVYGFVGMILLVGLVKKNGIMMVDFALEAARKQHKAPLDAIFEASLVRFRPIMMTTLAALVGTLPIAIGLGAGGEARQPLGLTVVGGLLFSQALTLYVTPVIYVVLARLTPEGRRSRAVALAG